MTWASAVVMAYDGYGMIPPIDFSPLGDLPNAYNGIAGQHDPVGHGWMHGAERLHPTLMPHQHARQPGASAAGTTPQDRADRDRAVVLASTERDELGIDDGEAAPLATRADTDGAANPG
jgi:hypothetical protein